MAKKRGPGEGSIIRRTDGTWQASLTVGRNTNGSQKRKYFYGKTRSQVAEKLSQAISEFNLGILIDKSQNPTVHEWVHTWLWKYKKNNIKQTTFEQYESLLRLYAIPKFGEVKISELKPDVLQTLYNSMYESGISARTIALLNTILHGALKQALKNGLVLRNVTEAVSLPKSKKKK